MKVLLDACVPKGLRNHLSGHETRTAQEMGWGALENGALLDAIGTEFEAFVTVDRGLPHQQHVANRAFAVIVLRARTNRLGDLLPLVPRLLEALSVARAGSVTEVTDDSS